MPPGTTVNSKTICVDASVVVRLVVDNPLATKVAALWETWADSNSQVIAPSFMLVEVTNALYRYERTGRVSAEVVDQSLAAVLDLPIVMVQSAAVHACALAYARGCNLSATYDAHYLATATEHDAEFYTCDAKLTRAVAARFAWVHLISSS